MAVTGSSLMLLLAFTSALVAAVFVIFCVAGKPAGGERQVSVAYTATRIAYNAAVCVSV